MEKLKGIVKDIVLEGQLSDWDGYNTQADIITNSFVITGSVTSGDKVLSRKKRLYIGAHRTNRASVRNLQGKKYAGGTKMSAQQWACARVNKLARLKKRAGYDRDLLR